MTVDAETLKRLEERLTCDARDCLNCLDEWRRDVPALIAGIRERDAEMARLRTHNDALLRAERDRRALLNALASATKIAWDLGIPDDDAVNAHGIISDLRALHGLAPLGEEGVMGADPRAEPLALKKCRTPYCTWRTTGDTCEEHEGCKCNGEFSRPHNPQRGCPLHGLGWSRGTAQPDDTHNT